MKRISILAMMIGLCFFTSCTNNQKDEPTTSEEKNTSSISEDNTQNNELSQLEIEASRLKAGGSIKSIELKDGNAKIVYVKDYKEYKELNPQSRVDEATLKSYWETGDAIEKALVDSPVRLMRKLDFLNKVSIILPYNNENYQIEVSLEDLEKFTEKTIDEIRADWNNNFSNPYIYDDAGRSKFYKKFSKN